ncbi:type I restriction enzyme subunit R domain-containing protein [Mycoplasmopsis phocirhinis]|nr:DEAD/DEAH box helicase family protein [Mycoplasmopsis phocirhinis]
MPQFFNDEKDFQSALIEKLITEGKWKNTSQQHLPNKLNHVSEEDIWQNWRQILNQMNQNELEGYPLTDEEFEQIKTRVNSMTAKISSANEALKYGIISFKRLEKRSERFGNEIQLRFFKQGIINPADNIYQIASEVSIKRADIKKRLDLVLLINGLPLYHIELKRSANLFSDAVNQIKNYHRDKVYQGIFGFVHVLVAMTPTKMQYWPNATKHEQFDTSRKNATSWANLKNEKINNWEIIAKQFLSIPASHKLVQNYSIGNNEDDELILLRSYQFHAVEKILAKFKPGGDGVWNDSNYNNNSLKAGYVWHTTGSGKTLTSFIVSRLLLDYKFADGVIFVVDRIALNNQTQREFNRFENRTKEEASKVNVPKNSTELLKVLATKDNKIIITTINRLNKTIHENEDKSSFTKFKDKKYVFIFDEAHRSTSGSQLSTIIQWFSASAILGFTGTPIFEKNSKNNLTTEDIFGKDRLHQYTISDGIKDKKVLKFAIDYITFPEVITFFTWIKQNNKLINQNSEEELQQKVDEFRQNYPQIHEEFNNSTDSIFVQEWQSIKSIMHINNDDNDLADIEDKLLDQQYYQNRFYKNSVANFILKDFYNRSSQRNFSAIFATSSIQEAVNYFNMFQQLIRSEPKYNDYKITAIFDETIDNTGDYDKNNFKKDAIEKIIQKYNEDFKTNFNIDTYKDGFKNDILQRLARKGPYNNLIFKRGNKKEIDNKKIDIVIVVSQLLTGYDSKYINTVYFDKMVKMENLIQAFSRTNRILNAANYDEKKHGNIVCFKAAQRMKSNVKEAFLEYAHAKDLDEIQTVSDLELVLNQIHIYQDIKKILTKIAYTDENENIVILFDDENNNDIETRKEFSNLAEKVTKLVRNDNSLTIRNSLNKLKNEQEYEQYQSNINEIKQIIPRLKSAIRSVDINEIYQSSQTQLLDTSTVVLNLNEIDFIIKSEITDIEWLKNLNEQILQNADKFEIIEKLRNVLTNEQINIIINNWDNIKSGNNLIEILKSHERQKIENYALKFNLDFTQVWNLYNRSQNIDENNGWNDLIQDWNISTEVKNYCKNLYKNYRGLITDLRVQKLARAELEKLRQTKNNDF